MSNSLNDALEALDITEWFDAHGVEWRRTGNPDNVQVRDCPFCGDGRWRVYVSKSSKQGKCFHADCPKGGFNVFSMAREVLAYDTQATIRHFEDWHRQAMPVAAVHRPKPEFGIEGEGVWRLPDSQALPTPEGMTHPYLQDRGVLLETQQLFGLRWCQNAWFRLPDAKPMNFGGRIILPVHDIDGSLRTFVGRATDSEAEPRYLFPTLLPGTGRFLYGGHLAEGAKTLLMVEGPFDTIAAHQAITGRSEFPHWAAVGSFGIALSRDDQEADDQLHRLITLRKRGLETVVMMWDGERNAWDHAVSAAERIIRGAGLAVKLAQLPSGADPADIEGRQVRAAAIAAKPFSLARLPLFRLQNPYV